MPGIAVTDEEEDEDIEFVTAVTAGEKNAKRKSDEFGETMISKKPKHDGAQEKTWSVNAVSENDYSEKVIVKNQILEIPIKPSFLHLH